MTTPHIIAAILIVLVVVSALVLIVASWITDRKVAKIRQELHDVETMSWPDFKKKYGLEDWE